MAVVSSIAGGVPCLDAGNQVIILTAQGRVFRLHSQRRTPLTGFSSGTQNLPG
jgi:hypothetical protein